jgi:2-acylglycerol O-acyltransferase 2
MVKYNVYFIAACAFSVMRLISIKPIVTRIYDYITTNYGSVIKRVRQNIRETLLVKGNMTNNKQAIYLLHPHGTFSLTHVFHVGTTCTEWPYRNVRGVAHSLLYKIPFLFDFIDERVLVNSGYHHMKQALTDGDSISMCLGNYTEGKYKEKNRITAIVKKRSGIFRLAIETGVPIIPVLSYGEQSMFQQINTGGFLGWLSKVTGIQLNFPDIASMKKWHSIYMKPLDEKIVTHIGEAIDVGEARTATPKEINELRVQYIIALQKLYRNTRPTDYEEEIQIV